MYILIKRIFEMVSKARPVSILCTSRRMSRLTNRRSWNSLRLKVRSDSRICFRRVGFEPQSVARGSR